VHQAHACHAYTPPHHDDGQKDAWAQFLEQNVGQRLEDGIADEEDCERGRVLAVGEAEVSLQAIYFCVADVCAVKEGDDCLGGWRWG